MQRNRVKGKTMKKEMSEIIYLFLSLERREIISLSLFTEKEINNLHFFVSIERDRRILEGNIISLSFLQTKREI